MQHEPGGGKKKQSLGQLVIIKIVANTPNFFFVMCEKAFAEKDVKYDWMQNSNLHSGENRDDKSF